MIVARSTINIGDQLWYVVRGTCTEYMLSMTTGIFLLQRIKSLARQSNILLHLGRHGIPGETGLLGHLDFTGPDYPLYPLQVW